MYHAGFVEELETGLRTALPLWGLAPEAPLRLLTVSENATFVADDRDGRPLVFRVHRPGYHTIGEIHSELAWLQALRADDVAPTSAPRPLRDGSLVGSFGHGPAAKQVVAFSFVPGREPEPGCDLAHWFRILGGVTARLHRHAKVWRRPNGFHRKTWDFAATAGPRAHWGDWRAALGLDAAGRSLLERAAARLEMDLAAYGTGPGTFGLVHGDLRPANLLVEGDHLTVIDFDDCGFGWFMYDFAAAVSFMEHEPFIPELEAAWLDGYAALTPVAPRDAAMLPTFRMLRRLQLTAWVASHAETPTAQAMGAPFTQGTVELAERHLTTAAGAVPRRPNSLLPLREKVARSAG